MNSHMLALVSALLFASSSTAQTCTSTIAQTEGPYYRTPNPETQNLYIAGDGPVFTLRGRVVDASCNPLPWCWIALWHADDVGAYDNTAPYNIYRATYFADANGEFEFTTINPGLYPGRTRHFHIKVDGANTAVLTTQLYWPGEPANATDGIYSPLLEMDVTTYPDGSRLGEFEFVVPTAGACTAATIVTDPVSTTAEVGATATFTATGAGSTPRTFRWYRNGAMLVNGNGVSGATTGTLVINGVDASDAGSYVCGSHNSCGSDFSTAATLTVPSACPSDLNGDGTVDATDLSELLSSWGACKTCGADIDGDGAVGGSDLAILLSTWGGC